MAFVSRIFDSTRELTDYLNDIIVGKAVGFGPFELTGLTLTIAGNLVTFTANETHWPQIVAKINAASAGSATLRNYGHSAPGNPRLAFTIPTQILLGAGTAKATLGLPAAVQTVGANAVAAADIASINRSDEGNRVSVIHQ